MIIIQIRFYEELNDFLPPEHRKRSFAVTVREGTTLGELIETCGVPVPEVDLALLNSRPAGLRDVVSDQDRVSVYPVFERFDIGPVTRVRHRALRSPRFIADQSTTALAGYLRMLGFDTLTEPAGAEDTTPRAARERRIVLARHRPTGTPGGGDRLCVVNARKPREQAREVLEKLQLHSLVRILTRCISCNAEIERAADPDGTRCRRCGRVYRSGPHVHRMIKILETITAADKRT